MDRNRWMMHQDWDDLYFIHWPVPAEELRPYVPEKLDIDEFDGSAWIAVVPFRMKNIRFRGLPEIPFGTELLELNVRTYVSYKGEPGVYFITLDSDHPLGVFLARSVFGLPYVHASMRMDIGDSSTQFSSHRTHKGYPAAQFHAEFQTVSEPMEARPGSLLYWLTERYALWVVRGKRVYKGPIIHNNWKLQKAEAAVTTNHLLDFLPSEYFRSRPVTYYSKSVQTRIFPYERKS
ncbi:YqjF family protein [Halobacillus litoralis]|uniref:YqjF family protein n=1 Tax=Halobacillus litoralis TaxID=45668 RepID=UPI001CD3E59A|nr:DUF2071 domain-containing protein [Halobacillus litoralis]MCA1020777.1 DUF2071 domain-containing protein [Halobacillus litoralis]